MFLKSVLITSLLVISSVNFSEAIQCYVCSSLQDQACASGKFEPKDAWKRNCDTENKPGSVANLVTERPKRCSVLIEKDTTGVYNITHRSCHWEIVASPSNCFKGSAQNDLILDCNSCDSDLCNSATKVFSTIGGTFLMMIIVGLFLS